MRPVVVQLGLVAAVVAVGAIAVAALVASRPSVEPEPSVQRLPLVQVATVRLEPLTLTVTSQGTVTAADEAVVAAEVAGRVESVAEALRAGALVRAGEVLATLDERDLELALVGARAAVAEAHALLDRERAEAETARRDLEAAGVEEPSPLALREPWLALAEAQVESAAAAVAKAELDLARATVRAPFDALVVARLVEPGQVVAPGTALAHLAGTERFEVLLPLSTRDRRELEPLDVGVVDGPDVRLVAEVDGRPATFAARITRTRAELDPRSRTLGAIATIDAPLEQGAAPLRLGSFVEARIAGRRIDGAAALPIEALRGPDEVWVVDAGGRLRRRTVAVAQRSGRRAVVESGLAAGELVVISELDLVVDGMRVDVDAAAPAGRD